MRIHVEGIDKTGKSTLVKYLSEQLNMPIIKVSQPKTEDSFAEYQEMFGTAKENKKEVKNNNTIFDRSWVGEQAYGPIYRQKKMKKFQVKRLDEACIAAGDLIVFCDTDKGMIKKKFIEDKEDFAKLKDIGRLQRYFTKTIKDLKTTVITYNRQVGNMDSIVTIVKALSNKPE